MNYTVIHKSGWASDQWRLGQTFTDKKEANRHAAAIRTSDAKDVKYNVVVKAHRNKLKKNWDNDTVKFSDGTIALI